MELQESPIMSGFVLITAVFLASAVEMVEALTLVLAVGITRGWRSALIGVGAAIAALVGMTATLGPALSRMPINGLRLIIGALLLIFGLQWLRQAILRASGYRALHDEDAIYRNEIVAARQAGAVVRERVDWYSFTLCFKGVFLEGLEVVFIVLTFGTAQGSVSLAVIGAAAAVLIVGLGGVLVHAPLTRVPENAMKFAVGVMLTTFGIFWGAEGAGVEWPGREGAVVALLAFVMLFALGLVALLRQQRERTLATMPSTTRPVDS
jgi:uncharacterized membrane protein